MKYIDYDTEKVNKTKYIDYDTEYDLYGIFDTETGFCYGLYYTSKEAEKALNK